MTADSSKRTAGLAWALASAVGGALMVIPWKLANEIGEPADSVLIMLSVAALGSTLLALGQRLASGVAPLQVGRADWLVAMALAVLTLAGNQLSAWAIQDLTPALLNVLLRTDILIVALVGWWWLGERVERRFWLGAAVACVGLLLLQGPSKGLGAIEILRSGTGLAIGAAACFSGLALLTRAYIDRIDPVAVNMLRLWLAVLFWFLFNALPSIEEIPPGQILYATLAAIGGPFLGRLALMIAARYVEARVSTLCTLTTPVLTLFLAFLLLADWPEAHELIGGAVMIGGIAIPLLRWSRG
jgi:drug/metabolite transporter (DMT)-like permease